MALDRLSNAKFWIEDGRPVTSLQSFVDVTEDENMIGRYITLKRVLALMKTGKVSMGISDVRGFYFEKKNDEGIVTYDTCLLESKSMHLIFHLEPALYNPYYEYLIMLDSITENKPAFNLLYEAAENDDLRRVYSGAAFASTVKECGLTAGVNFLGYLNQCKVYVDNRDKALTELAGVSKFQWLADFMYQQGIVQDNLDDEIMEPVINDLISYEKEYNIDYFNEYRYPLNVFHKNSLDLVFWKHDLL